MAKRKKKTIYLDNNSTTKTHKVVIKKMLPFMTDIYGNCSSSHAFGQRSKHHLDKSRQTIANALGAKPDEIIFCSGATEANNLAIRGYFLNNQHRGKHIIVNSTEHASVLKTCEDLDGAKITYIPVDQYGIINYAALQKATRPDTILCIVMSANNEIGTVNPTRLLKKIGLWCHKHNIHFHCDATQTIGNAKFFPKLILADSASFSSHKFHGPKGVGGLWISDKNLICPCTTGGGQEFQHRAGTESLYSIVGMATALRHNLKRIKKNEKYIRKMRDCMENCLKKNIPGLRVNGHPISRKVNTLSICLPGVNSRKFLHYLDRYGIYMNIGSACSQGKRSHVLEACGVPEECEKGLLRISLSEYNTMRDCRFACAVLIKLWKKYTGKLI